MSSSTIFLPALRVSHPDGMYLSHRTLGVINPLLVAETVQHVRSLDQLMRQIAALAIRRHRREVDHSFDAYTNALSAELAVIILKGIFDDWDSASRGYLTPAAFEDALAGSNVHWGAKQRALVFNTLDSHQYDGRINFSEFFATMAPYLSKLIDELQGHASDKEDWTPNLTDISEFLEEAHARRKERLELQEQTAMVKSAGENDHDSDDDDGDDDNDGDNVIKRNLSGRDMRDNSEIRAASGARIRQEALIAMKSGPAKLPVTKNPPVVAIIHDAGTSSRVPHAPPPAREVDPNEAADRRLRKFVQERSSANSSRARRKPKDEGGISDMIGMTANFFSSSITPKRREQHATTEDEAGTRL